MKRTPRNPEAPKKSSRAPSAGRTRVPSTKPAKQVGAGGLLEKVRALIAAHPGIRPSEINRRLNLEQSDALRGTLLKRGLIRKEKDGTAMRYYIV